jgi:hypothetical protein
VNGVEELALMCAHFAGVDFAHELRVFVDKPRLSQHVCRRVFELQKPEK